MTRRITIVMIFLILFAGFIVRTAIVDSRMVSRPGQEQGQKQGLTASAATFVGSLESDPDRGTTITGRAVLIITSANEDDTMTGRIQIQFDEATRELMARQGKTAQESIPAAVTIDPVSLFFRKGTSCPDIRIEAKNLRVETGPKMIRINDLTFRLIETPDPLIQLFCALARQINVDRHRLGIIRAINRTLI
ncbi:MAG: hypothetical protein IPM55_10105 [Acidobacteria bacterium]|nr:hypothetical protein [Acidobacteriota bacterium]